MTALTAAAVLELATSCQIAAFGDVLVTPTDDQGDGAAGERLQPGGGDQRG
jgi:hypothetical protein